MIQPSGIIIFNPLFPKNSLSNNKNPPENKTLSPSPLIRQQTLPQHVWKASSKQPPKKIESIQPPPKVKKTLRHFFEMKQDTQQNDYTLSERKQTVEKAVLHHASHTLSGSPLKLLIALYNITRNSCFDSWALFFFLLPLQNCLLKRCRNRRIWYLLFARPNLLCNFDRKIVASPDTLLHCGNHNLHYLVRRICKEYQAPIKS